MIPNKHIIKWKVIFQIASDLFYVYPDRIEMVGESYGSEAAARAAGEKLGAIRCDDVPTGYKRYTMLHSGRCTDSES